MTQDTTMNFQLGRAAWARASDAELRLIADNMHGHYSEGYSAAAREELARRIAAHTPPAPAGCVCGHAAEAHDGEGCNSHVSSLLPDATMAMACTCAAYTPAPAAAQEGGE
jgi:hypothetical protein